MKSTCTILFALVCNALSAQSPVLHRANYPEIGDNILLYHKFDFSLTTFSPGSSGPGVTWDFSAMDFNHPSVIVDTILGIDPVGTPFHPSTLSADYSLSNLCLLRNTEEYSPSDNDYNYYYVTDDSVSFIGHWANGGGSELWEDHCTDLIKELAFPFSYSDHFTDPYTRFYFDMSGSDDHHVSGTNNVSADGYGTLITPDGELLNDVLRIHSILSVRDSNALFGINEHTQHNYRWYSAARKGFILSFDMSRVDSSTIETADYQKQAGSVGVENIADENSILVYPNPNQGQFQIRLPDGFDCRLIEIVNMLGQNICSVRPTPSSRKIELAVPQAGLYLVRIYEGEDCRVRKVMVGQER